MSLHLYFRTSPANAREHHRRHQQDYLHSNNIDPRSGRDDCIYRSTNSGALGVPGSVFNIYPYYELYIFGSKTGACLLISMGPVKTPWLTLNRPQKVTIDVCKIFGAENVFLQQAAHLTGGAYVQIERMDAMLQYMMVCVHTPAPQRCLTDGDFKDVVPAPSRHTPAYLCAYPR